MRLLNGRSKPGTAHSRAERRCGTSLINLSVPGNVRELDNVMATRMILVNGR